MAVAYQRVLVRCGMNTVSSSVVVTRRRRMESKRCTNGTRNPLGSTGTEESAPSRAAGADSVHTCVSGPYSWLGQGNSCKASWGSNEKSCVMAGKFDFSHATVITSSITELVLQSAHETSAWKTPSPVTWTRWIAGMHVGSMMMLPTAVSPACRQLCRVGVCQPRQ